MTVRSPDMGTSEMYPRRPRRPWYRDWMMLVPFFALCASVGALAGSLLGVAL